MFDFVWSACSLYASVERLYAGQVAPYIQEELKQDLDPCWNEDVDRMPPYLIRLLINIIVLSDQMAMTQVAMQQIMQVSTVNFQELANNGDALRNFVMSRVHLIGKHLGVNLMPPPPPGSITDSNGNVIKMEGQ